MHVEPYEPLFGLPTETATSAKQLVIERIPLEVAVRCNKQWHSQLPDADGLAWGDIQLAYAAIYDHGIYGVGIWTRPVAANRIAHPTPHLLELRRLAIPDYAPKYTATRMLGRMRRRIRHDAPDVCRLLSYQVTDVHTGTIYKAANWHSVNTQGTYQKWTNRQGRKAGQNVSPKVRWELDIRDCKEGDPGHGQQHLL